MNLKNMERKPKEKNAMGEVTYAENKYGYGLEINLDDQHLKALGITKPLPAGTVIMLEAKGIVESTRESIETKAGEDSDNVDVHMTVQLTDMAIEPEGEALNPAEILYRNS